MAISRYALAVRDGLPLPVLTLSVTPGAQFMRARRAFGRRRAAADGVKYHDRMASDPLVCQAAFDSLPPDVQAALRSRRRRD